MSLERFKKAQEEDYETALAEIRSGRKRSHWMWYIFPQIDGLGYSFTARYYAIQNLDEAKAYLHDPLLSDHLNEICESLLSLKESDPYRIFGSPDDLKLCSSMTLFEQADPDNPVFGEVLDRYYQGKRDQKTLNILKEK